MPRITLDEVITQGMVRGFIQLGGPSPLNNADYYGISQQYFFVSGIELANQGDISPINMPSPYRRRQWDRVGREASPPDLSAYSLSIYPKHGTVPRALGRFGCPLNTYLTVGPCKDPSAFDTGWSDFMFILSQGEVAGNQSAGDFFVMDGDAALGIEVPVKNNDSYAVGQLNFGEEAGTEIDSEVIDVVYGVPNDCQVCDNGEKRIYAITTTRGGSPNSFPEVIYSLDGGLTWSQATITGLGGTATPVAIDIVGSYLVVLVSSTDSYFYVALDDDTGAPGATWTQVTTGFVGAGTPNDMYVKGPSEVYFCGDAGYIYKSTNITAGVTVLDAGSVTTNDLRRIHGASEYIVTVGESGTIVISRNRGITWATATTSPSSATFNALWVVEPKVFWVGTSGGLVYYTDKDAKTAFSAITIGPSLTQIQDIYFATDEVGYVLATVSGPDAQVWRTFNGGLTWNNATPGITGLPTFDRGNRIASPRSDVFTSANHATIAGLAGNGTDGVLLVGAAAIL